MINRIIERPNWDVEEGIKYRLYVIVEFISILFCTSDV